MNEDVYIIGFDMIKFVRFPNNSVPELAAESILLALGVRHLEEALIFVRGIGANSYARILANPESIKKTLSSSILNNW